MAEQVEVKIITASAVQSLADLRKAISDAKGNLEGMDIAGDKYQQQLEEIIKMQSLMKNALYATKGDFEGLKNASEGVGTSYNALVKHMADLKREFRATEDAARRMDLATQIKDINDQLKEMDASQGNFQRNVGNYASALKAVPPTLGKIRKEAGDIGETLNIMGKQPILGMIGLLAPLIMKIADGLKENETAMAGIKKLMDSLKPVTDFFAGILDKIADILLQVINEVTAFLGSSGILQKVIQGVMGVGNAILKFVIAPFKGIVEAIKVFKEKGVKGLGDAAKAFGQEMKNGVAFKENFSAGQAAADGILLGMASRKKKAQDTGKAIGKEVSKAIAKEVSFDKENKEWLKSQEKFEEELSKSTDAYVSELNTEIQAYIDAMERAAEEEEFYQTALAEHAQEQAQKKIDAMQAFATGTADLLDAIADAYESNGELTEKEEKRVKNLRIAAATISMLQGAVTAYATAQSLGVPMGPIVGAINAAAVVATGLANIAKIKATNVSRDSSPSTSAPTTATPAAVQAPALETAVPTTTVVNGASTETALNNASRPQKVYLVESEVQAAGNRAQVVDDESSF